MINDLKDLRALLTLCRSKGITEFKMNGLEIKFGDLPTKESLNQQTLEENTSDQANPFANFPDRILTPEELMFYSAGGKPEEEKDAI